jgi:HSP20 family protein
MARAGNPALLGWTEVAQPAFGYGWDAFERLRREMDGLLGRAVERAPAHGVHPPVDLYESSDGFVLTAELPGLTLKDIELTIEANRLTLRGERRIAYPDDGKTSLHRRERQTGTFRRTVALPAMVDGEKVEASYRDGVLIVKLPKADAYRSRRIEVRA